MLGTGSIYAGSQEAVNKVDTGVVNIEISEYMLNDDGDEVPWEDGQWVLPGMTVSKIPYFTATGIDCYIRATVDIEEGIDVDQSITVDSLKGISNDWVRVGDYFYYKEPLKTGESVDFFHSFLIPSEWDSDENLANVGDWGFSINVTVDAIQSENFIPDFNSSNPWGDIIVQESIHKDGYDVNLFTTNSETTMSVVVEDANNIVVKPKDFFEGFKTMVPGDVLTDSVKINSKGNYEIFFSSESLADIDLLQKLGLKLVLVKDVKEVVIYDSSLDAEIDRLSLGKFTNGEEAELIFTVSMPVELDNEYTLRNASVKWSFEVEPYGDGNDNSGDNGTSGDSSSSNNGKGSSVKDNSSTGDNSHVGLLLAVFVVSGSLIAIIVVRRKKDSGVR